MRVLFDTSALFITKTGVTNYIVELINAFHRNDSFIQVNELAYQPLFSRQSKLRVVDSLYRDTLWPSVQLTRHARKKKIDLIHSPAFNHPLLSNQKLLITIHDVYSIVKPKTFHSWHGFIVKNYISKAINNHKHILVLTEFTKNEILQNFPLAKAEYIHVVHSGIPEKRTMNHDPELRKKLQDRFSIHTPYILSVSTIEPRKNFYNLIKAFSMLQDKIDHKLVLVGQNGWNNKEVYELIKELKLEDRVCFTGFVEDEELNNLYTHADCFVFPSYYEGFGFTPLEAMKCGCPVVSSNASCMPEVLGETAVYFNPKDNEEMAASMHKMLLNSTLQIQYRELGLKQAAIYNWDETARKTFKVYQSIVAN